MSAPNEQLDVSDTAIKEEAASLDWVVVFEREGDSNGPLSARPFTPDCPESDPLEETSCSNDLITPSDLVSDTRVPVDLPSFCIPSEQEMTTNFLNQIYPPAKPTCNEMGNIPNTEACIIFENQEEELINSQESNLKSFNFDADNLNTLRNSSPKSGTGLNEVLLSESKVNPNCEDEVDMDIIATVANSAEVHIAAFTQESSNCMEMIPDIVITNKSSESEINVDNNIMSSQVDTEPSRTFEHNEEPTNILPTNNSIETPVENSVELPCTSVANTSNKNQSNIDNTILGKDVTAEHETENNSLLTEVASEQLSLNASGAFKGVVNIYGPDTLPKWYQAMGMLITRPIIPTKLSEAFQCLPIHGRPKSRANLEEFYNNKIKEFVGCNLNDEEFEKLARYCSPSHLTTGKELTISNNIPQPGLLPEENQDYMNEGRNESELCVVKKCRMRVDKDPRSQFIVRLKYRGLRMNPFPQCSGMESTSEKLLEPGKDVLFIVRVYRPFTYNHKDKPTSRRHSVFSRNIVLHGRQTLTELRDRIICNNEVDLRIDISENPDELPSTSSKELFPSGFLFINNVFYVDSRAGCHDISACIRTWAEQRGLGRFPAKDMAQARLDQIAIKLGHPEVYLHQGNCEHLFTFSEIRLVNPSDALQPSLYPCHTALAQNNTIYCSNCAEFGAKWIVTGCTRVPFDPAFFCDSCFRLYMYKNGKKIGDFKAYSYMGNDIK